MRKSLRDADAVFDAWVQEAQDRFDGGPPIPWFDWIEFLRIATMPIA